MKHRTLGKTGMSISEIGFGCGSNGGIMFRPTVRVRLRAVQRALELGINYFDTAPQYGQGQSESNLGQILEDLGAQPYVATKVRLTGDDMVNPVRAVSDSVTNSLSRLKRDYVDVLLLHNPVCARRGARRDALSVEDVLGAGGVLETMEKLRSQGRAHFLGFTGLGDTDALHSMVKTRRFHVVQAYYNILNPSAGEEVPATFPAQDYRRLIEAAASAGMGVLGIRILAAGALSDVPPDKIPDRPLSPGSEFSTDLRGGERLRPLLRRGVGSLPELALRYALANKQLSSLLIGFAQLEHVDQAMAWAAKGPLPISVIGRIREFQSQLFST